MFKMASLVESISLEYFKKICWSRTNLCDMNIVGPVEGLYKYELECGDRVYETLTNEPITF